MRLNLYNGVERLDGVTEDHRAEQYSLCLGVAVPVDDLHLLHYGRLARLPGAEKEEFDLSKVSLR